MAIIPKQFSTIEFPETTIENLIESECGEPASKVCQLVENDDNTQFQVDLSVIGSDIITDGVFAANCGVNWACGGSWAIGSGVASINVVSGTHTLSQATFPKIQTLYKIEIDFPSYVAGTLEVESKGSTIFNLVGDTTEAVTRTIFLFTSASSSTTIQLRVSGLAEFDIDNVTMTEVSSVKYTIKDLLTGNTVFTDISGTSVTYHPTKATAKIDIDWTGIAPGRYEVCLFGSDNKIVNGTFDGGGSWNVSGSSKWTFPGTVADMDAVGPSSSSADRTMDQTELFAAGDIYGIRVEMLNFVGGTLTVFLGASNLGTISADGVHFFEADLRPSGTSDENDLIFVGSDTDADFEIDNVEVSTGICSECFCVAVEHKCTLLLKWNNDNGTNNRNAFGFDYETLDLVHTLRLMARLTRPFTEDVNRDHNDQTNGTTILLTSQLRINEVLVTRDLYPVPSYIHEAIYAGLSHKGFLIDDIGYTSEENTLEPEWSASSTVAAMSITVFKKNQNFNNEC